MSIPRMSQQMQNGNNRRPPPSTNLMSRVPPASHDHKPAPSSSQHDDLIKYIFDSWSKVSQEVDRSSGSAVVYYQEQENRKLKDFQPFDLEAYWGRRLVQNVQQHQHS